MGNDQSIEYFKGAANSSNDITNKSACSPLKKKFRFAAKSVSLKSLVSLGKIKGSSSHSSSSFSIFKSYDESLEEVSSKLSTFPREKQKHGTIVLANSDLKQHGHISNFWRDTVFLPEFPFRDDICVSDFTILNVIGVGTFGKVVRASNNRWINNDYSIVAIKIQSKERVLEKNAEKQIKSEVMLHKKLEPHNFIAKFIDCWQTTTHLYSILECVSGYGDLYTLWNDYGCMTEEEIKVYGAEIALALGFLHDKKVLFRDLKMENLVLDMEMHVKLVDFGFAKRLLNSDRTNTICGTLQYMAPEIAWGEPYGKSVDWWSYGTILYILFTGNYPFPNSQAESHSQLIFHGYKIPDNASESFQDLLKQLLEVDECLRISTFHQIKKHSFFENILFHDIMDKKIKPWDLIKRRIDLPQTKIASDEVCFDEVLDIQG